MVCDHAARLIIGLSQAVCLLISPQQQVGAQYTTMRSGKRIIVGMSLQYLDDQFQDLAPGSTDKFHTYSSNHNLLR